MEDKYLKIGAMLLFTVLLFGCTTSDDNVTSSNNGGEDQGNGGTAEGNADQGTGNGGSDGAAGNADLYDWCQAGTTWSWSGDEGSANMEITGMAEYKGDMYCHVTISGQDTGQETTTVEYYFKEDDGETVDMWMVMYDNQGNMMSEQHVVSQN